MALSHTPACGHPHREFQDSEKIAFSGQGKVPVIVDKNKDGKWVNDSWAIAKYLEATYPDRPSLFNGPAGVHPCVARLLCGVRWAAAHARCSVSSGTLSGCMMHTLILAPLTIAAMPLLHMHKAPGDLTGLWGWQAMLCALGRRRCMLLMGLHACCVLSRRG